MTKVALIRAASASHFITTIQFHKLQMTASAFSDNSFRQFIFSKNLSVKVCFIFGTNQKGCDLYLFRATFCFRQSSASFISSSLHEISKWTGNASRLQTLKDLNRIFRPNFVPAEESMALGTWKEQHIRRRCFDYNAKIAAFASKIEPSSQMKCGRLSLRGYPRLSFRSIASGDKSYNLVSTLLFNGATVKLLKFSPLSNLIHLSSTLKYKPTREGGLNQKDSTVAINHISMKSFKLTNLSRFGIIAKTFSSQIRSSSCLSFSLETIQRILLYGITRSHSGIMHLKPTPLSANWPSVICTSMYCLAHSWQYA